MVCDDAASVQRDSVRFGQRLLKTGPGQIVNDEPSKLASGSAIHPDHPTAPGEMTSSPATSAASPSRRS